VSAAAGVREVRLSPDDLPAPGEIRVVEVGRVRVGVFRVGSELYALADRCPHRGAPLCSSGEVVTAIERQADGTLALGEAGALVRCPWHKWDFEIATGGCPVDPRLRVRRYAVRRDGEDLIVTLDAPTLADAQNAGSAR
jgi:3-phenylpropionate/trans-cinnamate dioxygenase ferredoxin subunit